MKDNEQYFVLIVCYHLSSHSLHNWDASKPFTQLRNGITHVEEDS